MEKIYLVTIKTVETGYYSEDDICQTKQAFDSEEKARDFLENEFHNTCDEYDRKELGIYEYFEEETGEFHLQDNGETEEYGDWYVTGYLEVLDVH